jgi:regulator of RNase E activity RraA
VGNFIITPFRTERTVIMLPLKTDADLFAQARAELYTAVIGDICDQLDLRHQFLAPQIRPLQQGPGIPLLIGRAMTVLEADVFDDQSAARVSDHESTLAFGRMLEALDDLKQDEIYICAGASPRYALVGEIMATAMKTRGAVGAVC